jgi:hypothetical protein
MLTSVSSADCSGASVALNLSLNLTTGVPWPRGEYSIRQTNCVHADQRHWCYADIVPYDAAGYPNTYNTSIHLFSSPDPLGPWRYESHALPKGAAGAWDAGGVATPGVALADGTVVLVYSGRQFADGSGRRSIGLATAPHPTAPFTRRAPFNWTVEDGAQSDDPQLVRHPSGRLILLHRRTAYSSGGAYTVLRAELSSGANVSASGTTGWSAPLVVLSGDATVRAREPFDAKWLGNASSGRLVFVTDQFWREPGRGVAVAAFVSASPNATGLCPAAPPLLSEPVPRPFAGPNWSLIQRADGAITHALLLEGDASGKGYGPVAYALREPLLQ